MKATELYTFIQQLSKGEVRQVKQYTKATKPNSVTARLFEKIRKLKAYNKRAAWIGESSTGNRVHLAETILSALLIHGSAHGTAKLEICIERGLLDEAKLRFKHLTAEAWESKQYNFLIELLKIREQTRKVYGAELPLPEQVDPTEITHMASIDVSFIALTASIRKALKAPAGTRMMQHKILAPQAEALKGDPAKYYKVKYGLTFLLPDGIGERRHWVERLVELLTKREDIEGKIDFLVEAEPLLYLYLETQEFLLAQTLLFRMESVIGQNTQLQVVKFKTSQIAKLALSLAIPGSLSVNDVWEILDQSMHFLTEAKQGIALITAGSIFLVEEKLEDGIKVLLRFFSIPYQSRIHRNTTALLLHVLLLAENHDTEELPKVAKTARQYFKKNLSNPVFLESLNWIVRVANQGLLDRKTIWTKCLEAFMRDASRLNQIKFPFLEFVRAKANGVSMTAIIKNKPSTDSSKEA